MGITWVHPDYRNIPDSVERVITSNVVEDSLFHQWMEHINRKGPREYNILAEPTDSYWFDIGGICKINEPEMELQLDGWKIGMMVRHAEYLLPKCRRIKTSRQILGPHVHIGGWKQGAILTVETAEKIALWLDTELPKRIAEADQLWARHRETMADAGVYVPPRNIP